MRTITLTPGLVVAGLGPTSSIDFSESNVPPQFAMLCVLAIPVVLAPIAYLATLSTGALVARVRPARRQRV